MPKNQWSDFAIYLLILILMFTQTTAVTDDQTQANTKTFNNRRIVG